MRGRYPSGPKFGDKLGGSPKPKKLASIRSAALQAIELKSALTPHQPSPHQAEIQSRRGRAAQLEAESRKRKLAARLKQDAAMETRSDNALSLASPSDPHDEVSDNALSLASPGDPHDKLSDNALSLESPGDPHDEASE